MKRFTNYMTTAAAALMITAGVASAQSLMKAEIPFAFVAGGKVLEPGTYRVRVISGMTSNVVLSLDGLHNPSRVAFMPKYAADPPRQWVSSGEPRLAFDCSSGVCFLSRIWKGEGNTYELSGPKKKSGETLLTEIVMKPDKGD